jgi:F-type H+-transporting ATPase subunit alpha
MDIRAAEISAILKEQIKNFGQEAEVAEVGQVLSVGDGIARIYGLDRVQAGEMVEFSDGTRGMALNLEVDNVGVVIFGDDRGIKEGDIVKRTGAIVEVPVGKALLGRVVDALGNPIDGKGPIEAEEKSRVDVKAPGIIPRQSVHEPMQTGLKAVDALIPIGRGQRELIVGDRQTGKTAVAVDTMINQRDMDVICVYCAIGQRGTAVARVVDTLRRHDAMDNTIVVVASDDDPPGLRYITPYAATTMAEYFMERGRDALIVYDDLTRHARAYREISLLLRRPPGREAYPGDIFYIHSRLLERATHLCSRLGGGSLTALPIIETKAQDISAYIPTNLISITDGQIYLSPTLFHKGLLPAIDVGRSVSRVGGKTQYPAYRSVAGDLRLSYAQFEELETFARFATRLDDDTRSTIEHGRRVREILKQNEHRPLRASEQIASLKAVNAGLFDDLPLDRIEEAESAVQTRVLETLPELCEQIESGAELGDSEWRRLIEEARAALGGLHASQRA